MKTKITKNLIDKSITLGNTTFKITLDPDNEAYTWYFLHGCQQRISDSVAGMTLKGGHTEAERIAKMTEVADSINEGKVKLAKGERVIKPEKAIDKVMAIPKPEGMSDKDFAKLQALLTQAKDALKK